MDYYYQNQNNSQNGEPDYYAIYTENQIKSARSVFSRYHLALFIYMVLSYAVVIAAELIMLAVLGIDGMSDFLKNHAFVNWIFSFAPMYFIGFPVFYLIIRKMKKMPCQKRKMSASEFFSLFLISEVAMTAGSLIGEMFNGFFSILKGGAVTDHTSELIDSMPIWLTFLIVVIIGPVFEELLFRKFMIDRFSRYGSTVAIIVSAVSFGLFHGNLYQFFYAALLGLVLGFMYAKTRNVIYPILLHVLINFLGSVVAIPISEKMEEMFLAMEGISNGLQIDVAKFFRNTMIVGSYTVIQYAMLIGGAIMLYSYIKKRRFKIRDSWEYKIPRERVAGAVILNVGTMLFLLLSAASFAYSIII